MKNRLLLNLFFILFIIGCSDKIIESKYYPTGELQIMKYKKGTNDTLTKVYYKNGQLKEEYQTIDGKNDGEFKYYSDNGVLIRKDRWSVGKYLQTIDYYTNGEKKSIGQYRNNRYNGWFTFYTEEGLLKSRKQYIPYDTNVYLNQFIYFKENGDTLKEESNYFTLYPVRDTIFLGEEYKILIKLDAPFYKEQMEVFVDNMADSTMMDVYNGKNFKVYYSTKPLTRGKHILRGQISDYRFTNTGNDREGRPLFFEKAYFVK